MRAPYARLHRSDPAHDLVELKKKTTENEKRERERDEKSNASNRYSCSIYSWTMYGGSKCITTLKYIDQH